jgi:two-component system nitrogen regulation response regulator GlnG
VRVIAATDAKLEELNATGAFDDALYNRLTGGMVISLPPLRERREDIGLLFLHCLRKALGRGGAYRLADVEGREEWLPARAVAAICCHALPGNFRNLEGLAAKVSVEAKAFPPVIKKLREFAAPSDTRDLVRGKLSTMTLAQIVDVLHQAAWNMSQAARTLGVEPSSLSRRLRKDPHIHAFAKLSVADLERRLAAAHGDVAALARQLGVSTELLSRRLSR